MLIVRPPSRRRPRKPRVTFLRPPPVGTLAAAAQAQGLYRVADLSIELYELYHGVDAAPDFTAPPSQTSATTPITTSALGAGHAHRLVLRRRNRHGLPSQNLTETLLDLDGAGTAKPTPPSDADAISLSPEAGGKIRVSARYNYLADGDAAATQFLIFLTTDGSTPSTASAPTVVPMVQSDGTARLDYDTAAQMEGTVVKAIVRTRRTDSTDSANTAVLSATATLLGPGAPTGSAF